MISSRNDEHLCSSISQSALTVLQTYIYTLLDHRSRHTACCTLIMLSCCQNISQIWQTIVYRRGMAVRKACLFGSFFVFPRAGRHLTAGHTVALQWINHASPRLSRPMLVSFRREKNLHITVRSAAVPYCNGHLQSVHRRSREELRSRWSLAGFASIITFWFHEKAKSRI